MNRVQPGSFLTLHYRLAGPDGTAVVDTFADRPATLSMGTGELAPAMEARLLGLQEGAHAVFELAPGEAFGEHLPVSFPTPDGRGSFAGLVREVADDWLLFDFNHPLAGRAVTFEVRLIGVL